MNRPRERMLTAKHLASQLKLEPGRNKELGFFS